MTRNATTTAVRACRILGDTWRSVTTHPSHRIDSIAHGTPAPHAAQPDTVETCHTPSRRGRPPTGRPTLAAVAARAGVSPSTASLTFAGSPRVAPATRERILAAAAELGYAGPDPIAASLRRGRIGVVGTFIGERLLYAFRDPVAVQLLDGITEVLGGHGVGLLLLAGDSGRPAADQLARIPLDAAIFATCGLEDDPALDLLRARGVPIVGVEGPVADDVVLVDIDDRAGTAQLAAHLHELGHRRVAVVAMPLRLDGTRGPVDAARRARTHYRDVRHRIEGVEDVFGPVPDRRDREQRGRRGRDGRPGAAVPPMCGRPR